MEDFKDVMLAEPPARFAAAPAVHPTSLESYKGILLCGRPSDGARIREQGPAAIPFLPAGKPDDGRYLGLQPSVEERARVEMQKTTRATNASTHASGKRGAVISKHKKWLVSFAKAVQQMKQDEAAQLEQQQQKLMALREREAAARRARTVGGGSDVGDYGGSEQGAAAATPPATSSAPAAAAALPPTTRVTSTKMVSKKKPKWAMTEDEALDAEFAEARDLLDFAASLDFNKFMQDYEVREAMAIMKDRIQEIAQTEGIDLDAAKAAAQEAGDDDDAMTVSTEGAAGPPPELAGDARDAWLKAAEERRRARRDARRAARLAATGGAAAGGAANADREAGWDRSVGDRVRSAVSSEALRLADKVLASSDAIRKIHSRQSLAKVLQDAALTAENRQGGSDASFSGPHGASYVTASALLKEPSVELPKVATYAADATRDQTFRKGASQGEPEQRRILTDLRKATDKAQNLPYLYRCPSI